MSIHTDSATLTHSSDSIRSGATHIHAAAGVDAGKQRRGVVFAGMLTVVAVALGMASAMVHAKGTTQGTSFQGSALSDLELEQNWLQGESLAATLADGRHVAITGFAGDIIHAVALDDAGDAPSIVELRPLDLVGMEWFARLCIDDQPCDVVTYRITGAALDESLSTMPLYPSNKDIGLYQLEYTFAFDPGPDDWKNPCAHAANDTSMGMFVDGRWRRDGSWASGGYTFSCASGVIAKCARNWGYKPWKTVISPGHGAVAMQSLHQACVRAARADYCGDGQSHTMDGTLVDLVDGYGLNPRDTDLRFASEAGFDENGAVWAHHPRIVETETGAPECRRRIHGSPDQSALIEIRSRTSYQSSPDPTDSR